jgi:hypothetical protein
MEVTMRHLHSRGARLAACAVLILVVVGGTRIAGRRTQNFGDGETADDAVRRGILAGDRIPRNIHEIRELLQRDPKGVLRSHVVANGGHGHATPSNVDFMCFETFEGPLAGRTVGDAELLFGFFLARRGSTLSVREGFVELIAWDRTKRMYNFWELIGPDWHYRGDANDIAANVAALNLGRSDAQFAFTKTSKDGEPVLRCSGCHTLGTPVMKEIDPPHNDWWRTTRPLPLDPLKPDAEVSRLLAGVADASNLARVVKRGIDRLVTESTATGSTLAQRLRSLATTMEMNLASDTVPLQTRIAEGTAVEIPAGFFVDTRLVEKPAAVRVDLKAYRAALKSVGSSFPPESTTSTAQESHHAFLVPTRSYVDNRVLDDLIARGVLDEELVADVLAVDLTTPVFSRDRGSLMRFFPAAAANADEIRKQLVAALKKAGPADAAAAALLANITDPERTPAAHRRTAATFLASCQKAAAAPGAIEGWLRHAHGQRAAINTADTARHPTGTITEDGFRHVFPGQRESPRRFRLNPATCLAEPRP